MSADLEIYSDGQESYPHLNTPQFLRSQFKSFITVFKTLHTLFLVLSPKTHDTHFCSA